MLIWVVTIASATNRKLEPGYEGHTENQRFGDGSHTHSSEYQQRTLDSGHFVLQRKTT